MKKRRSPLARLTEYLQLTRNRAADGGLPVSTQLYEMLRLLITRKQGPGYYHTAGFWRPEISWAEKTAHMNADEYRAAVNRLNKQLYRKASEHKLIEKSILSAVSVPTPKFVGYLHGAHGRSADGEPLNNADDLARLIDHFALTKFCLKPAASWAGQGFRAVAVVNDSPPKLVPIDSNVPIELDNYIAQLQLDKGAGFVLECYLEQHPWYAELNPTSVNTFRIWVVRENATIKATLAYLRMGRADSIVDNQSAGGVVAPIDLESGQLGMVIDGLPTRKSWANHPDSDRPIAGQRPPQLDEALLAAEQALTVFPHLDFAGVDVAMAPDGPQIIELNTSPDREAAAFTDTPTRRALRLD